MAMSASPSAAAAAEPLVHAAFNSNATHFVAATASGVRVFSCGTPLKHAFSNGFVPSPDAGAGSRSRVITADLAPSGMLAAVVFRPEPPSATAAAAPDDDDGEGDRIKYCSYVGRAELLSDDDISPSTRRAVRAVRHAGSHVLVAGDGSATLHGTPSGRAVKRCLEVDTGPNPLGVCALAEARDGRTVVVACPRPAAKGQVQVLVCRRQGRGRGSGRAARRVDLHAHSSRVVCVALSHDGRLLATASSKGTVVRIFTTADGTKASELRRGADRADIYSMAFSPDSRWLAVSSDKGTIHVFSVNVDAVPSPSSPSPAQEDSNNPDSDSSVNAGSALNAKQGSSWSFFSGFVPGYFRQDGSLAKFRLREGVKYVVAFSHEPNTILVVGMDGSFYRCEFDPVKGGDMKQLEYRDFMKMK